MCLFTRLAGKCDWVFENHTFIELASSAFPYDMSKLLWINGSAGFSKSVLCAPIVQHLTLTTTAPLPPPKEPSSSSSSVAQNRTPLSPPSLISPPHMLAYFFLLSSTSDPESRGDPVAVVRSCVVQLVASNPDALELALGRVPQHDGGAATPTEIWELFAAVARALPHCVLSSTGSTSARHDKIPDRLLRK